MDHKRILIGGAAMALVGLLAGCGGTTNSAPSDTQTTSVATSGPMGTASVGSSDDIAFAQLMIPHHQQAITMADLALANASTPEVRSLAKQIKAAQSPEIALMTQWLQDWDAPMSMASDQEGNDMGNMSSLMSSGMMSDEDMSQLMVAKGSAFDQMWLQMMIAHHQGAIAMADQVLSSTNMPAVRELAQAVIEGQSAEIATMQRLIL